MFGCQEISRSLIILLDLPQKSQSLSFSNFALPIAIHDDVEPWQSRNSVVGL